MLRVLFLMLAAHALFDFPLQGDFLARGKHPWAGIPGVPFVIPLTAHALLHSAAVYLITGSAILAGLELYLHGIIDYGKCWLSVQDRFARGSDAFLFSMDQALHVLCKVLWVGFLYAGVK